MRSTHRLLLRSRRGGAGGSSPPEGETEGAPDCLFSDLNRVMSFMSRQSMMGWLRVVEVSTGGGLATALRTLSSAVLSIDSWPSICAR